MKSKIYIKHWLALKPQDYSGRTDLYYLKIANMVKSSLGKIDLMMLSKFLDDNEINELCCFLTCYFEDVISEVNIWGAFKSEYAQLYGKKLPFYEIDDNYIDEEINIQDVAFLVWYYINASQDDLFVNPYNAVFFNIADSVMLIFDQDYEYAPENLQLKKIYQFEVLNDMDAFYETRTFMQFVFFESYLFMPDVKRRLDDAIFELIENNHEEEPDWIMGLMREITEDYAFNQHSKLLSLTANQWTSAILGTSHKEYKSINAISKKIKGYFLFKKQDNKSVYLEHIASGMKFKMTKKSFEHHHTLNEDDIVYIGLVNHDNEWWFSGNYIEKAFDSNLILDERNSAESRAKVNFLLDQKQIKNVLELQKKAFLEFNEDSLIAFVPSSELQSFINEFKFFYNSSLNLSETEISEANQRTKAGGFFGNESNFEDFDADEKATIVFFNVNEGIEFYVDVIGAFPDGKNPFFVQEEKEDINHILMADNCSTEFANYLVDNYKDKLDYFKTEPYKSYLKDLDFLLRFWKKSYYHSEARVVLTGNE